MADITETVHIGDFISPVSMGWGVEQEEAELQGVSLGPVVLLGTGVVAR